MCSDFDGQLALIRGQSDVLDPFGWSAASLEWLATYLLLWPEDGRMKKEDIKGVYDVSPASLLPSLPHRSRLLRFADRFWVMTGLYLL